MSERNRILSTNPLTPYYPHNPSYDPNCSVNQVYQTLPSYTPWSINTAGPSSIKHLYTGKPNYYPMMKISKPVGTLYNTDNSQFVCSGIGKGKRLSYQYKPYPFTDKNVREVSEYADHLLPYADYPIKHPIIHNTTVNSSLQVYPHPYRPE